MSRVQILPTLLIVINIASAAIYMADGDWRKTVYWMSAACLTFAVTF